jgi:hypothetical protein
MKVTLHWVVASCILIEVYRRFRSTFYLHHQSVNFYHTKRCNNPEEGYVQNDFFIFGISVVTRGMYHIDVYSGK